MTACEIVKQIWGKNDSGVSHHVMSSEKLGGGTNKPANRHLIAEDAISIQKTIGNGEFGVVQQAIWTNEHGERVSTADCW